MNAKDLGVVVGSMAAVMGLSYFRSRMSGSKAEVTIRYDSSGVPYNEHLSDYYAEMVQSVILAPGSDSPQAPLIASTAFSGLGGRASNSKNKQLASVGHVVQAVASHENDRIQRGLPPKGRLEAEALASLDGSPEHLNAISELYEWYRVPRTSSYR